MGTIKGGVLGGLNRKVAAKAGIHTNLQIGMDARKMGHKEHLHDASRNPN